VGESRAVVQLAGTSRSSVLALCTLMMNSNLVARGIGRSVVSPFEDAADIDGGQAQLIRLVGPVAHQSADFGKLVRGVHRGHRVARRKRDERYATVVEQTMGTDQ
jgi:hypothetical protein